MIRRFEERRKWPGLAWSITIVSTFLSVVAGILLNAAGVGDSLFGVGLLIERMSLTHMLFAPALGCVIATRLVQWLTIRGVLAYDDEADSTLPAERPAAPGI
jgi:hypothetical protein